ncbi:MAG: helix-turn-helix transcriptional regulator [Rudanella sp.]|nr:helix-turn-helix transcriptional regulator [Rudanella sp.]
MKTRLLPDELTTRQRDVLRLICAENSTVQIAHILQISVNTVESHRKAMFRKLGIKNSAGLVKYAFEKNLL